MLTVYGLRSLIGCVEFGLRNARPIYDPLRKYVLLLLKIKLQFAQHDISHCSKEWTKNYQSTKLFPFKKFDIPK